MQEINFLKNLFHAAVEHSQAQRVMHSHLPSPHHGKTFVVAIGKAGAAMAKYASENYPHKLNGIAIVPDGHQLSCDNIKVYQASHPLPDERGNMATQKIISEVRKLEKNDLLLFLVSGGGSALMNSPIKNVLTLTDKININKQLLASGANIAEINIVRKHLSEIKGGQLAKLAAPANVLSLAISDVPNDDPATIASGPTMPDPSTLTQTIAILQKYKIAVTQNIMQHLQNKNNETPKAIDPIFANCQYKIIYKPQDMINWLEKEIGKQTNNIVNLGANVEGEARTVAKAHAEIIKNQNPEFLISGGETSVTLTKNNNLGIGGRNSEYLLALAIALESQNISAYALAADTDGIDGNGTNAGAFLTPQTIAEGNKLGMDAKTFLQNHDSYNYFKNLNSLITTGPTLTNVNDLRIAWQQ